ncbi:MAG: FAD:protein FMN transferase [Nitrospinales bacterium]
MNKFNRLLFLIIVFIILGMILSCSPKENNSPVKRTQLLMGTLAQITISVPSSPESLTAIDKAFDEIKRIENLLSSHRNTSEVSQINKNAGGKYISVSAETVYLIQEGIRWGKFSDGIFDITIGPLIKLWNFEGGQNIVPDSDSLRKTISLVNYNNIQIDGNNVRLNTPGMALDMGGIAKGYAVDRAIEVLKKSGVKGAIINAGGDLMAYGTRSAKDSWVIGLQHPRKLEEISASFAAENTYIGTAVATSGDYQKFFMVGDNRYSHILDPHTGLSNKNIISATVTAPSVMQADILATIVFILGPDKGKEFLKKLDGVEAMWINKEEEKIFTEGFQSLSDFKLK